MLSVALKEVPGPLNQLLTNLAGENGQRWLEELKKFLRKEPCWVESLLEFIGTITIPARTEKFVAKENFVVNTERDALVKISHINDNFKKRFGGKVDDIIAEQTLHYAKILKPSVDTPVISEIGGEAKAETTLVAVYILMTRQPNGEGGALLINSNINIFYVRDIENVLCAVYIRWCSYGWVVLANSLDDLGNKWFKGSQVFYRNNS